MANNMLRLLNDHNIESMLRKYGYEMAEFLNLNTQAIDEWIQPYNRIIHQEEK